MTSHVTHVTSYNHHVFAGGCFGSSGKNMVTGSWAWAWWLVTDVQKMSLEVTTMMIMMIVIVMMMMTR